MTYQTKEQSIGYLLTGLMDLGMNRKELKENIGFLLNDIDDNDVRKKFTNYDTLKFARRFAEWKRMSTEEESKLVSNIYWAFDTCTVEEAGERFEAYNKII